VATDTSWISGLVGDNLMAVYDVALDVHREIQFEHDAFVDLLPSVVRFSALMPMDGANFRDRYCELRWKAAKLLQKRGALTRVEVVGQTHRWESKLRIVANLAEFETTRTALETEFKRRAQTETATTGDAGNAVQLDGLENLRILALRLHSVIVQLRQRHASRATLDVADEYDVQDLLHALLRLHFDDIRPEEWTPSYAGKAARVDFLLKPHGIVIEVKKTRLGLGAKEIGDQLVLDIQRYSKMADCKTLFCLVYDPENRIVNPGGFQSDLSDTRDGMVVEVMIVPKQY